VCGEIIGYNLNRETNTFTLDYFQDKEYDAPTEIFVHKEPKSIECDSEYVIDKIGDNGAGMLKISAKPGKHTVKIIF
jgi:hypothetical protein